MKSFEVSTHELSVYGSMAAADHLTLAKSLFILISYVQHCKNEDI